MFNKSMAAPPEDIPADDTPSDTPSANPVGIATEYVGGGYIWEDTPTRESSRPAFDQEQFFADLGEFLKKNGQPAPTPPPKPTPTQPPPTPIPSPKPGTPIPIPSPTQPPGEPPKRPTPGPTPSNPPAPVPKPATPTPLPTYPGVAAGTRVDAAFVQSKRKTPNLWQGDIAASLKFANNDPKKWGATESRKLFATAAQGYGTPWWGHENLVALNTNVANQAVTNQKRLDHGLFPLTSAEFARLHDEMIELANSNPKGKEITKDRVTQLNQHWNEPYDAFKAAAGRRE